MNFLNCRWHRIGSRLHLKMDDAFMAFGNLFELLELRVYDR
jgi:hypothetical protein